MAVMKQCCCCGIRQGSIASAIYSLIIAVCGVIYFAYSLVGLTAVKVELVKNGIMGSNFAWFDLFYSVYVIALLVFVVLIVACILVLVGVMKDVQGMLVPFLVAKFAHMLWYLYYFVILAYFLALVGLSALIYVYLAVILLLVPFFVGDLVCFLCVLSQYQEYGSGRGRAVDGTANSQTLVIQQPMTPAPAAYPVKQQGPPPAYN